MPIHDWTRVEAEIFHAFHLTWLGELQRCLNGGLLPSPYYALAEQIAGGREPDVITLKGPATGGEPEEHATGAVALASAPPKVRFRARSDEDKYATKAKSIVIRHTSRHQVIAIIEIISPGNKSGKHALRSLVEKASDMLRGGIHLLIVDLFPPGKHDPQGIHRAVWDEIANTDFMLPAALPLTLAAYIGGPFKEHFVEPTAVGQALIDMPLFLTAEEYIPVPLEATYQSAWQAVPAYWRGVLEGAAEPG